MKGGWKLFIFFLLVGLLVAGYFYWRRLAQPDSARTIHVMEFIRNPQDHPDWTVKAGGQLPSASLRR